MSIINQVDGKLTQGAMRGILGLSSVAQKGGMLGKAAGLLKTGVATFGKMTPVGKALTIGTAVLGVKSLASRQPAAQRVGPSNA